MTDTPTGLGPITDEMVEAAASAYLRSPRFGDEQGFKAAVRAALQAALATQPIPVQDAEEPKLTGELRVGVVRFGAGVKLATAQGVIDRLAERAHLPTEADRVTVISSAESPEPPVPLERFVEAGGLSGEEQIAQVRKRLGAYDFGGDVGRLTEFELISTLLDHLTSAQHELAECKRREGELAEALIMAAEWFEDYERQHLLKCTEDGDQKAEVNRQRAAFCRAALARTKEGEG